MLKFMFLHMKTVITVHNSSFSSFWLGMNFSVSTVSTCLRTKTAFLTPDSESAWKFTLKNLLHTSFYDCFRLKRLPCVINTEFRILWKMTCFCRFDHVWTKNPRIWHRIRDQHKNLPRNPYSIRLFIVVFSWHSYMRNIKLFKIRWSRFSDN